MQQLSRAAEAAGTAGTYVNGAVYGYPHLNGPAGNGSPPEGASALGSQSPEDSKPAKKAPAKRGRKKMIEELPSDGEIDLASKRKIQNRAAQRAFRDRKEKHLADLEQRVKDQAAQLEEFRTLCDRLTKENEALRRGEQVPLGELPPIPPCLPSLSDALPSMPSLSLADTKPVPALSPPQPRQDSFDVNLPPPQSQTGQPALASFVPTPLPFSYELPPAPGITQVSEARLDPRPERLELSPMDLQFDFDAPFDLSDAVPLPPLFQNFFDQYSAPPLAAPATIEAPLPSLSGTSTPGEYSEEACPGEDDDDPPALTADKMPCPECDFSVVSCALPLPWRPATIGKEVPRKDVWQSQKAWAKLCSHPLFSQCDVNELCTALRDNTRCSDDGRLVISKADVCAVFRSIPARARVKREQEEMSR